MFALATPVELYSNYLALSGSPTFAAPFQTPPASLTSSAQGFPPRTPVMAQQASMSTPKSCSAVTLDGDADMINRYPALAAAERAVQRHRFLHAARAEQISRAHNCFPDTYMAQQTLTELGPLGCGTPTNRGMQLYSDMYPAIAASDHGSSPQYVSQPAQYFRQRSWHSATPQMNEFGASDGASDGNQYVHSESKLTSEMAYSQQYKKSYQMPSYVAGPEHTNNRSQQMCGASMMPVRSQYYLQGIPGPLQSQYQVANSHSVYSPYYVRNPVYGQLFSNATQQPWMSSVTPQYYSPINELDECQIIVENPQLPQPHSMLVCQSPGQGMVKPDKITNTKLKREMFCGCC